MRCGGTATRLVSDFNACPVEAGAAGPKYGASVIEGATSGPSRSIKISSSGACPVGLLLASGDASFISLSRSRLSSAMRGAFFFDKVRRFLRGALDVLGADCTTTMVVGRRGIERNRIKSKIRWCKRSSRQPPNERRPHKAGQWRAKPRHVVVATLCLISPISASIRCIYRISGQFNGC
jgi:hypothetical protein